MNIIKKLEKEFLFKNNIKEITSISLDSEYKVENEKLIGDFLVSGDYKIHEVSLNREKFNFKIPFKEELESDVDQDTIKLEILNFEYDYRKDELLINVEYEITGDRKDVLIFENEETLDEFLNNREIEVIDTRIDNLKESIDNTNFEGMKEMNVEIVKDLNEDTLEQKDLIERKLDNNKEIIDEQIDTDEIINNIDKPKDNFITYKIYKIEENDTIEGIVLKYKTTLDDLKEYNDLNNLQINDKIIIPNYE